MRRRSSATSLSSEYSSNKSDGTGSDVDDFVESDTDLSDVDVIAEKDDKDEAWLSPNEDHPPEYYLQQLETFDEQEYTREDYQDSSTRLLDRIEDQWNQ
jgi:hypothetical protein